MQYNDYLYDSLKASHLKKICDCTVLKCIYSMMY